MGVVIDASVALAWGFTDENDGYARDVLAALAGRRIIVPAIWQLEIANGIIVGERRGRLSQQAIHLFQDLLKNLNPVQDNQSLQQTMENVIPVARMHNLTAYDASYLELASRCGLPLATLDVRLMKAAQDASIAIFRSRP